MSSRSSPTHNPATPRITAMCSASSSASADEAALPPVCVASGAGDAVRDGSGEGWGGSFFAGPGSLLFANETSDARDHCANERTFLSHLRLSILMAVLSLAITLSFHLTHQPTDLERRMAKPLGALFWALSLLMLILGLANYIRAFPPSPLSTSHTRHGATILARRTWVTVDAETVNKYGRRTAIVQTGWRTQLSLGVVAVCIFATCVVLLVTTKMRQRERRREKQVL
ncbi:hypothetical protein E4U42_002158 [Claviceps africana]|uniref:DUF202 domain-containing protein n=1 Tax=Claviceps africana TaxID=83212 RepID=A0A8K0JBC5_9HYPO|nr:hypothetical protein E4U42_002158 [Claviceps africana]